MLEGLLQASAFQFAPAIIFFCHDCGPIKTRNRSAIGIERTSIVSPTRSTSSF
jgi:hypothetical protein